MTSSSGGGAIVVFKAIHVHRKKESSEATHAYLTKKRRIPETSAHVPTALALGSILPANALGVEFQRT